MPAPLVVPDASVLLKWVLPPEDEPNADKALLLRSAILDDEVYALVPELWLYEVGNTVARRFPQHASAWISALMKFGLDEVPLSQPSVSRALELTGRYQVSFYDAAYHSLAIHQKGTFVTADAKYVERVKEAGSIVALGDWTPPRVPTARRRSRS